MAHTLLADFDDIWSRDKKWNCTADKFFCTADIGILRQLSICTADSGNHPLLLRLLSEKFFLQSLILPKKTKQSRDLFILTSYKIQRKLSSKKT